jgi:hypothetical protein
LKDLLNSRSVISTFAPLRGLEVGQVTDFQFTHMNCNVLNMAFFDVFQEAKVCHADGGIRGNFEEIIEGINCGDRLK